MFNKCKNATFLSLLPKFLKCQSELDLFCLGERHQQPGLEEMKVVKFSFGNTQEQDLQDHVICVENCHALCFSWATEDAKSG